MTVADAQTKPVGVGLIGAGWIGTFHGETLARRLPGARLAGVANPAPGAAKTVAEDGWNSPARLRSSPRCCCSTSRRPGCRPSRSAGWAR